MGSLPRKLPQKRRLRKRSKNISTRFITRNKNYSVFFNFNHKTQIMKKAYIIIFAIVLLGSCSEHYGSGERIGLITKFSRSGLIYKSWEGELHVTQTGMNSTMHDFDFSVDNNAEGQEGPMIAMLDSAAKNGWKMRVIYHEVTGENLTSSRGDTNFFVDSVQVLDKNMSTLFNNNSVDTVRRGRVIDTIYVVIVRKNGK